jgi:hypothetical protein
MQSAVSLQRQLGMQCALQHVQGMHSGESSVGIALHYVQ